MLHTFLDLLTLVGVLLLQKEDTAQDTLMFQHSILLFSGNFDCVRKKRHILEQIVRGWGHIF